MRLDDATAVALHRYSQAVWLTIRRLQSEVTMTMPAAAIEPKPQSFEFCRVPHELEAITSLRIIDGGPPLT